MIEKKTGKKNSVVIVDDNVNYCFVISEAINRSKLFYCEKYYHTARLAEKAMKTIENPPRILLLDINMPEVSGLDAIATFKKMMPELLIVMLTSFDEESDILTALQRGADGYINKSTNHVDLLRSLERLLKGGKTIDPKIAEKLIHATLGQINAPDYKLTNREMETLRLFAKGFDKIKIAQEMCISYYTVESHRKNIFEKMKVHTCAEMVAKALKEKLVV
jgi:DNA-binding NarL/FixJ family response regulator